MTASPETYVAYTDESGTREQYLALGGIFLPKRSVAAIEGILDSCCRSNGFDDREVSWKKCSLPKVERCIAFATLFWSLADDHGPLDFRALVVDTHRNPLRKKEWDCETDEDGLYKFYHFFISNAFRRLAAQVPRREIVVAALDDQYPYRTEILRTKRWLDDLRQELR